MESKKFYFSDQKNLKSYRPKLIRLILIYIHFREVRKLGDPNTNDIKNTLGLNIKQTYKLLIKAEDDGYITRYTKDKFKYCKLTNQGRSLLLENTLMHFPQNFQPEIRRIWGLIS